MKRVIFTAVIVLLFTCVSCSKELPASDEQIPPAAAPVQDAEAIGSTEAPVSPIEPAPFPITPCELTASDEQAIDTAYLDLSFKLLSELYPENPNILISPASIFTALSMTDMGAGGDTEGELRTILAGSASKEALLSYNMRLNELLNDDALRSVNSIWFNTSGIGTNHLSLSPAFEDTLSTYFGAEAKFLPFNTDGQKQINDYVKEKTDGMIDKLIEGFDGDELLILLNALAFDAPWEEPFLSDLVLQDTVFTNWDGTIAHLPRMRSTEYTYLESDLATGFKKYYKDRRYSFVGILPKDETVSPDAFLTDFDAAAFSAFCQSASNEAVQIELPPFSFDYDTDLCGVLKKFGVTSAFNPDEADLFDMVDGETAGDKLYVDQILHKTHIAVETDGTKAAAVTAVITKCESTSVQKKKARVVVLDRPFVFAIVNEDTGLPVFLGTFSEFKVFNPAF